MNDTPSLLVKSWPYWPYTELPIRSRAVPFTITSVKKLRLPAVASATFSSGMLIRWPVPGRVAMPQRGDDGQRRVDAARDIPRGQNVIHRCGELGGTRHQRKPDPGVDGVVHAGAAVGAAGHLDVDQVGPQPSQRVVRMPLPSCDIRDQYAAVRDQPLHQVLAFLRAEVGRHGALALVQARPVDAVAVAGDRPAVVVGRTADRVDADHFGPELAQRHPRQRHRDETGDLDDPHPGQRPRRIGCTSHPAKCRYSGGGYCYTPLTCAFLHRCRHRDVPLEAKRFRLYAVAFDEILVGSRVTTCAGDQRTQSQHKQRVHHEAGRGRVGGQIIDRLVHFLVICVATAA